MSIKNEKSSQKQSNKLFDALFANNKTTKIILAIAFTLIGFGHLRTWHTNKDDHFSLGLGIFFIVVSIFHVYLAYSQNKKT